jgi:hypothetical protein
MDCVQTYNSLGQDPCIVTAYMMATCDGGRKFFNCFHIRASWSYLFAEYNLSALLPGLIYRGANEILAADLCLCSTVGYSLFSACGACQAAEWMPCGFIASLFNPWRLMCLSSVGLNG